MEKQYIRVDAEIYLKLKHDLERLKNIVDRSLTYVMQELLESVNTNDKEADSGPDK